MSEPKIQELSPIIGPLISLAAEVMTKINADSAKKWQTARTENLLAIQAEEAKGDAANDKLIEQLYAKQPIIDQAAKDEIDIAMRTTT